MSTRTNHDLLLLYALPYALFVLVSAIPPDVLGRAENYALRIALVGAALLWARRRYVSLRGPRAALGSIAVGALAGLVGTAIWIALLLPFDPPASPPWEPLDAGMRTLAAVALVPLFEELLLRGYVLRLLVQWSEARRTGATRPLATALDERRIDDVAPGAWTLGAVAGSTVLFALGHAPYEWVASLAYGLLMVGLWIRRRDLLSCVVAHAVTNLTLALLVYTRGQWELW